MSDEEIRDLLDLGAQEPDPGDALTAEQLWSAGRRQRNRGRAWIGGLGAAAAAASILGVVWVQGLSGGGTTPLPPATQSPSPSVEVDSGARGEPYLARFDRANTEPAEQLSGASVPASLEDLTGTWIGPAGEEFSFNESTLTVTPSSCETGSAEVELTPEGRLQVLNAWDDWPVVDCASPEFMMPWRQILLHDPLLSLDGETLLVSGLDGTTDEPRVHVALSLEPADDQGFIWVDGTAQTGVTPIRLGDDVELHVSGSGDASRLDAIHEVTLKSPRTCDLALRSSLRSDRVLVASSGQGCASNSAEIALLSSGPTLGFDGDTMVISGTIPESLLAGATDTPDDPSAGRRAEELAAPSSVVVVLSEGGWAPSGVLSPLADEDATGRHWLPVDTEVVPPIVGDDVGGDRGLTYDGTSWRVRECGIDVTVPGRLEVGVLVATGDPVVVPDPDPGAACVTPELMPDEWAAVLTSQPRLSTDGEILVISGRTDDGPLEPVGMALLGDGVVDPTGGPTRAVTLEDLAGGLTEVPSDIAVGDVGVSDHLDLQPGYDTTLTVRDGILTLDVGCPSPLRGPAWFSQVGPEEDSWQLTAALPREPSCGGQFRNEAAAGEAELWRQMLAHGTFLHHFGDYVILDAMADEVWASADGS